MIFVPIALASLVMPWFAHAADGPSATPISEVHRLTELQQARNLLYQAQQEGNDLRQGLQATNRVPTLVGITGTPENLTAEFRAGRSWVAVRAGEQVTDYWHVSDVGQASVTLKGAKHESRRLGFGERSPDRRPPRSAPPRREGDAAKGTQAVPVAAQER